MRKVLLAFLLCTLLQCQAFAADHVSNITAEEAFKKLKNGNERFVTMKLRHPGQTLERRIEGIVGQHPFAVILTCSDSRVAPEIIFDRGLGDLFEIRNAGNVLDDHVIGSIEYAVAHLGTPVVVIMGHQDCGAVKAAIQHIKESTHIRSLVNAITPAVKMASKQQGDLHDNASRNNVLLSVEKVKKSHPIIAKYVEEGKVQIVGAYYHIDTGVVEYIK